MTRRGARYRYRCRTCGAVFDAWAVILRHVDAEHHHAIIECVP